jgi:hypothetical protein
MEEVLVYGFSLFCFSLRVRLNCYSYTYFPSFFSHGTFLLFLTMAATKCFGLQVQFTLNRITNNHRFVLWSS